jgi:hypothetical protein
MRMLNWENFDDGPVRSTRDQIHVTIRSTGKIFFNLKAFEALGSPDGVALMYDSRQKVIGVRPSKLNLRETYFLRKKHRRCNGWEISARNFCRRFKILPSEAYAFTHIEIIDGPILLLDLNEVEPAPKAARNVSVARL